MSWIARALTEHRAQTDPASDDPRLVGRTYTIPFEIVWQASMDLANRGIRRWTVIIANDKTGRIDALTRTLFRKTETEVVITIGLDENAQTRVDVTAKTRTERGDFGLSRRLVGLFFEKLDRKLSVTPSQILDPTTMSHVQESP